MLGMSRDGRFRSHQLRFTLWTLDDSCQTKDLPVAQIVGVAEMVQTHNLIDGDMLALSDR
jgi:hypothetical protein